MPVVAKAGGAGGLVLDDVDTGNLPVLVNVHMVVDNHAALAVIELVAVAQLAGDAPDVIDQARGHLQTVLFPVKLGVGDRKSTRLNSSHVRISYAVFCLKKKIK